jgi:hypothetical protein
MFDAQIAGALAGSLVAAVLFSSVKEHQTKDIGAKHEAMAPGE